MLQSNFKYQNTTASSNTIKPIAMDIPANYTREYVGRDTDQMVYTNVTAPIDAEEIIKIDSKRIAKVNNSLDIRFPAPVEAGVMYSVEVENDLVTTDSTDPKFRYDEPIVAQLRIRHNQSGNITADVVGQVVTRLISACMRADGTWRFDDFMRMSETINTP